MALKPSRSHTKLVNATRAIVLLSPAALPALLWFQLRMLAVLSADQGLESGPPTRLRQPSSSRASSLSNRSGGGSPKREMIHQPPRRLASIDTVVYFLLDLARRPPSELWGALGMDGDAGLSGKPPGDDPFSLRELEGGKCPFSTAHWLPPRPWNSEVIAERFRSDAESSRRRMEGRQKNGGPLPFFGEIREDEYEVQEVAIWYEDMDKASSSELCGLAQSNMVSWTNPSRNSFNCQSRPRYGGMLENRPAAWSNSALIDNILEFENTHAILSNEWDYFPLDKLEISDRRLNGTNDGPGLGGPRLLFLTSFPDPLERQFNAFADAFPNDKTGGVALGAPPFNHWIHTNMMLATDYKLGSKKAFDANPARLNHATWRFSGGTLPRSRQPVREKWEGSFERAIRALAQHDLVLPADALAGDKGREALRRLLGWDQFDEAGQGAKGGRRVDARQHFYSAEYRDLWEANWLDNILFFWCRAVFLARLHCE